MSLIVQIVPFDIKRKMQYIITKDGASPFYVGENEIQLWVDTDCKNRTLEITNIDEPNDHTVIAKIGNKTKYFTYRWID